MNWFAGNNRIALLRKFAIFWVATGLLGFFGSLICTIFTEQIPSWLNLPLGDVGAIAVDSKGYIYCSSQGYFRIQKYSPSGHFLRGWASPYKNPKLMIDDEDRLHVRNAYSIAQVVFNASGEIVPMKESDLLDMRFFREDQVTLLHAGSVFMVKTSNLWPRVVKISPNGKSETIINTSFFMWMIAGPLPGWLRLFTGILLLGWIDSYSKRTQTNKPRITDAG